MNDATIQTAIKATDIMFRLATNRCLGAEFEGMMRHTGAETVHALLRKLQTRTPEVIVGLWALRYTA